MESGVSADFDSVLVREREMERERLLKESFNMKLRINFLEEQLLRYKSGRQCLLVYVVYIGIPNAVRILGDIFCFAIIDGCGVFCR